MKEKKRYYITISIYTDFTVKELWHCYPADAIRVLSKTCDFIIPLERKPRKIDGVRIA